MHTRSEITTVSPVGGVIALHRPQATSCSSAAAPLPTVWCGMWYAMCRVVRLLAECAELDKELASIDNELVDIKGRHASREGQSCARDSEMDDLQQQLEQLLQQRAEQKMREITVSGELQQLDECERRQHAREQKQLEELEQTHQWHMQHRLPAVQHAAKAAACDVRMDDRAERARSSTAVSNGGSLRGSKKRPKTQQRRTGTARSAHSVQTIGGHSGGGGEMTRHGKVVQVQPIHTAHTTRQRS